MLPLVTLLQMRPIRMLQMRIHSRLRRPGAAVVIVIPSASPADDVAAATCGAVSLGVVVVVEAGIGHAVVVVEVEGRGDRGGGGGDGDAFVGAGGAVSLGVGVVVEAGVGHAVVVVEVEGRGDRGGGGGDGDAFVGAGVAVGDGVGVGFHGVGFAFFLGVVEEGGLEFRGRRWRLLLRRYGCLWGGNDNSGLVIINILRYNALSLLRKRTIGIPGRMMFEGYVPYEA
mmetsp:Transcript_31967/g.63995  ORF Transcript_31967/g.63995 Transcript_31967/m.63995 type:complete len:227 (+) Transcript_31967:1212-1892(+)